MEIITYSFTFKNSRNIFIALILLFNIQFSFSQVDLRTCHYDCTSNNYTLKDVYLSLSNVNGDPITNTTCTVGEVRQVYIYLNYSSNSNSNIYFARLNSDLTIAGSTTFINVLLGTIVPGDNKKLLYGPFNWTCGDELSLSNTIIAWKTSSNNNPGTNYTCNSYTNSQCDFTNSFVISKPLAVQFTYKACKTGTNTTVKFTSTTNGGIGPYTYAWDFRNDGGAPDSTISNPTFTYTTSNNSAKLTVTDSQNLTNSYIVPIVEPTEIMLSESHSGIGCSGGTTSLILSVTGGTPGYTYLWNTGATTKDLANITPGTYTVTVTDANSCTKTQTFIVNQPTTLTATTSQTNVTCFGGANGTATVTTTGGTAPYTYSWSPSGGTNMTATGLIAGIYNVIVTDVNNCTITKTVTIIDGDSIAPIINPLPSTTTIECPALPTFQQATATDNSGVVASLTFVDSITNNCGSSYTQIRTWTAKDACGNTSAPISQTIIIKDLTKPTWITNPTALNVTLQCSDVNGLANAQTQFPTASDTCDNDVSNIVKSSGVFTPSSCLNSGTYTNTWTVQDDCGNTSAIFTQVITIEDTTAPAWTTQAETLNVTLQCSDTSGLTAAQNQAPTATDNCNGTVTYTKTSGEFTAGSCANSGTYTNTWTAKDVCLNTSTTFTQVITIEDTTAPAWTTQTGTLNITLQCSDTSGLTAAQNQAPTAIDNCGGIVTYTKTSGAFTAGSCANSGTYTNTWIAKDVCLNTSTTFTQVITIEDTTAPAWTTQAGTLNVTLQCSDTSGLGAAQNQAPTATDNCNGTVTYTKTSGEFTAGSCANSGTYTNTWTAKDVCLNTSTAFTQVITIEDTTAPTWTTQAGTLNVTLQCSDTGGLSAAQSQAPTANDNCGGTVTYTKTSGEFTAGSCANSGTYTNTWTAKDVCLNTSTTFTQVITIEDTIAPTWTTQAGTLNVTLQCSDASGLNAAQNQAPTANDNCGGTVTYTKTSGEFTAGSCANSGTYTNTWTAKDVCLNTSTTFTQVITIEDTTAPAWTTQAGTLNVTLQCSDTSGLSAAQNQAPTATDNCGGTVTYTKTSGEFTAGSCANSGTYTNTWTAKDVCLNTSTTFTQVITIEDTTAPAWTTQAGTLNVTLQCSDTSGLSAAQNQAPTATDNCGGTVTYTKTSGEFTAGSCANSGTYTNTWTAKDVCLNTSTTFTQVITIEDTTAPAWTTQAGTLNVTLQCSDTSGLSAAQNQAPTATDNCNGTVTYTKTSGEFTVGSCANSGTYTNTWIAKDVCLNTSTTFTQVITIEDTTAPAWTTQAGTLNVTLQCSDTSGLSAAQNQAPTATDNCNGTVTYTKTSGEFTAGSCANSGTYTNTWTAKDVCLNTSTTFTQVITIEDTTAPAWTTQAGTLNVTLQCSDESGLSAAQNQAPTATDNCNGTVTYTKTSGEFTAGSCANSGTYTNTWTAKDVCLNTSTTFTQVITIEDTTAPAWTTQAETLNVTLQCSDASGLTAAQNQAPTATDNCNGTVTYTKTSGEFTAGSCANSGTYTNTWIAKDVCLNTSTTFTQVITIEDTTAPAWTTQAGKLNVTLQCSDTSGLSAAQNQAPTASDNCGGTVTYTKTSGEFTAGSCANSGTYTNTWIAKDVCLNTSTAFTQVITIEDTTAPAWTTQSGTLNVTLQCNDASGLSTAQNQAPTATDNCGGTVTYTKTSGEFTAGSCANSGTYTNTWIAKDVCLNTSTSFTQVITIEDTTAPAWTTQAGTLNVTLQCSDASRLNAAQSQAPTASDNCGGTVTYTKTSGEFAAGSCANSGTYTNTWTAKDVCLNTSTTFTQVITIEDTTAPAWTTQAGTLNVTLQCSDTSGLSAAQNQAPTATDNCGGTVTYTKTSGEFTAGSCANSGTYTNTWTAKDVCLNTSSTFTQVITIEDTTAPAWTTQAGTLNVTLQCSDASGLSAAQNQAPTATDNCNGTVTYTKTSGEFTAGSCANSGTYTNTWTAKDVCLNTSTTFTQVITIEDTTAPAWTTQAGTLNVNLQCSDTSGLTAAQDQAPTATDNCGGTVTYTKTSGEFAAGNCANSGTYTNTWTAKDVCLNTSTAFTQVITIEDTTAPAWTTQAGTLNETLQCSDTSGLNAAQSQAPTATDNCNGTVTYTKTSGEFTAGSCANSGTYTNTWTAKDVCLNTSSTFTQVITIEDTTAPAWTTQAGTLNVTLQCSDTSGLSAAQNQAPTASDNCGGTVTYTKTSGELQRGNCGSTGTYTNTWTAKDICNNTSTLFTQVITVQDTAVPTWITQAGTLNMTLQCSDTAGLTAAQNQAPAATANCSFVTYTKTSGAFVPSQGCANSGTYTSSWIAKDDCGNVTDAFIQVITIEDTTAPTWTTQAGTLNATIQCSDTEALASAQAQFPTAADNCDSDVSNIVKTSGQFMALEGCANSGTYTNTWTVKDDCGNTSDTFTQVITIQDTTAPTWTTQTGALNVTIQCSDTEALASAQAQFPTAADNCDADVSNIVKTSGQFIALEGCANSGTYTNTWTVKDNCGNTSDAFTQVITIQDTTAPAWTTQTGLLNVTIQCSDTEALASAQAQFPTAADNCDSDVSNIVKTNGQFMASEGCANSGSYTNTWTVKDECGNTSETFTQVITIQDTTAPAWTTQTGSLNTTIQCSDTEALASAQAQFPTASDNCDSDVSNIVKTSGQFMALEGCANSGTYTNTWTVKDDCGNTSETFTQVITIQDTIAPAWTTQEGTLNQTIECSNTEALASAQAQFPTANDNCDADVSNIVKTSGQFMASEGCANSGTYTNTWTAKDNCGNISGIFTQVITIQDTTAPAWTTQEGTLNQTIECSNTEALASAQAQFPTANDNCDADVSNIVKTSGQFVASEGCANSGTYTNTWTVKDDCGNTSETFTQVITIQDTTAPTWTTQEGTLNVTIQCSDTEALASAQAQFPTAADNCDADVSNIVKTSGQFMASEGCANSGTYTNTWTVKDDCGNTSDTFTQVITIQDTTAPAWTTQTGSLNTTIQCSDTEALASAQAQFPIATDACDSDVSIEKTNGQFAASEGCSNAGTYTNTWTAKDNCGNISGIFTQVITIQDTTIPFFIGTLPTDSTVSCDAVPAPAEMEASDNCSGNLPIVFSEIKSGILNECASNYTLTRKWTTSDCSGNRASYTQIITVRDTTPPTGTAPADVANLQNIADIPAGSSSDIKDAKDNCSSNINITVSDSNNGGNGCDGSTYILTRTYTLTDCAGNKTELVQTFTVENKVSVTATVSNATCLGASDGSIVVTSSPGATVIIRNQNNEVVSSTNLPAGTYTITATAAVNGENQTCTATTTVVITQPDYKVKISGVIMNVDTNTPIANVPVTLVPQGTTTGPILLHITGADGSYTFSGMPVGSYLVQVQDANLNSAYQLYPVNSSLYFTTLQECAFQVHNFEYGASKLPVLGDYVWYDTNSNGIQDEWYDANNDGVVTKNVPDSNGAIDFTKWEWIDLNGDGSYTGPQNVGELNAGGFGNAASANVIIDGPNGYHAEVIVGIEGFWRNRPDQPNPYGDYTVKLVRDANFDTVAAALGATGLVKVIPSGAAKKVTSKVNKTEMHTVCKTTSNSSYIATVTPEDFVHLDLDFGVSCKEVKDIVANDDSAGPIAGVNHTTTNVLNVLPNDTIEGVVVTPSDVIITTVTPNEFLQLNPDGSVDVLPNAPVGTLTMVYQICEADEVGNCDTATVTLTIEAPVMTITATAVCVNDVPYVDYVVTPVNFTPVNGVTIAWANSSNTVITTMTDLPLSGRVLWPGAVVDGNGKGVDWPGWIFQNNQWIQGADGFETLRPTVNLTLSVNPSTTITINYPPSDPYCTSRPTFSIVANDDNAGPVTATASIPNILNVYTNDTLNGNAVNPSDVTLTTVTPDPSGVLTLNPDGSVDVKANTPAGTYTLTYQICENADFGNCDTAIVTVVIAAPIIAADDTYNIGCSSFGLAGNVLSNDFKGQIPATLELVNFTLLTENTNTKTDPNITISASGNVTVSSITPPGTYTYSYQICDKLSANNCDTALVTIIVAPLGVTNITSEACNDDSTLLNLTNLLPEGTPSTGTWIDTNGSNALQGNILNPFGLLIGSYIFEYKITEGNCPRSVLLAMQINDDCKVLACGNVIVHNAFSPNGDGINDFFKIDNIDELTCYPGNTVEIYNRWGILVFETTDYNNTTNAFDGTSRGRTTISQSDGLPTGTYFYIINYKSLDGNNAIQNNKLDGYIYLSR